MPWEAYEMTASEAGYAGSIARYFENLMVDVDNKRLADVVIPLSDGSLQVNKPLLKSVTGKLTFTPTEAQLFSVYGKVPECLRQLTHDNYRTTDASLYVHRSVPNGEETPIEFKEQIVPKESNFEVKPIFPDFLTKGKVKEYDGFPTHEGIDDTKYELAKEIVKELRREGHPISIRQFECVKQACVSPREVVHGELLELMKKGNEIGFYVTNYESDYKRQTQNKSYLSNALWLKSGLNQLELGMWGSQKDSWSIYNLMCDLIKSMDLTVESDSTVTLMKPVEKLYSRIGGKIWNGIKTGLGYAGKGIIKPPKYGYEKLVAEPRRKSREIESQAVLET
ncbi:MAG: hypothetical protein NTW30_00015, partial [Candidatus Aenigmarchaeota archaeon]|nr:hypothetical protein [Candidatus Aenigmarchaeota archaeon]